MFWLLIAVLLLLSISVLAVTLLSLWRGVKALGAQVSAAGETFDSLSSRLDGARAGGPLGAGPCPTCGAPPRLVGSRTPAVRAQHR